MEVNMSYRVKLCQKSYNDPVSDQDIIEIVPAEEYDWYQAKLRASLSWLLSKAYMCNIPADLQDPFYTTIEGHLQLRPAAINLMSSSELYCQACSHIFPDIHTQWQGHWSIIHILSRKGVYISDVNDTLVTETMLVQTAPFKLTAHLALIEALMKAYVNEVASVEKVVKAVRSFTTFPASSELPDSPEDAVVFWINKVCSYLGTTGWSKGGVEILEGEAGQKVLVHGKSLSPREKVQVPLLKDLLKDVGKGCSVAATISFYRPHLLNVKDLCLKEGIGIADSLHNLRHIAQFCQNYLPWKCCHLSYEDLLYSNEVMKTNILAFLADLFFVFEGGSNDPAGSRGASLVASSKEVVNASPSAGQRSTPQFVIPVPVSAATKRSFQRQSFEETASNLGMGRSSCSPSSYQHQPLLTRRGRRMIVQDEEGLSTSPPANRRTGRRAVSLCSPQDHEMVHRSILAWQEVQSSSARILGEGDSLDRQGLLANVSMNSECDRDLSTSSSSNLDWSELDTPRYISSALVDPSHPDYLELESITSAQSRYSNSPKQAAGRHQLSVTPPKSAGKLEPLYPAKARTLGDKETNARKSEEHRGRIPRRRTTSTSSSRVVKTEAGTRHTSESEDLDFSLSPSSDETNVSSLAPTLRTAGSLSLEDTETEGEGQDSAYVATVRPVRAEDTQGGDTEQAGGSLQARKPQTKGTILLNSTHHVEGDGFDHPASSEVNELLSTSPSSVTSFAELKRLKDKLGHQFEKPQGQQQSQEDSDDPSIDSNGVDLGLSDLQQLRLKLEQKRKEIEKKKRREEVQQNRLRQRVGKAAFMRVISQNVDGQEEDQLCELPSAKTPGHPPNSLQAQLQARLGHPFQKLPMNNQHPVHPHPVPVSIGPGGQSLVTDWQSQTVRPKGGGGSISDMLGLGASNEQPRQFTLPVTESAAGHVTIDQQLPTGKLSLAKPFCKQGLQQAFDDVKNKWCRSNSVPLPEGGDWVELKTGAKREEGQLISNHVTDSAGGQVFTNNHYSNGVTSHPFSHHKFSSASLPIEIPSRESPQLPAEDYDSSLHKLNNSLGELQGEIMRLSLQQEQLKAAKSPEISQPAVIQLGISQAAVSQLTHRGSDPHNLHTHKPVTLQDAHPTLQPASAPSPSMQFMNVSATRDTNHVIQPSQPQISQKNLAAGRNFRQETGEVHFRLDDKFLPDHPSQSTASSEASVVVTRPTPSSINEMSLTSGLCQGLSGSSVAQNPPPAARATSHEHQDVTSSPKIGFVITEESNGTVEDASRDDMEKKRLKILELQKKRQLEQERKRQSKEAEAVKTMEEKLTKQEEQERKKMEEKARRDIIFQQYIQRKQEQEEAPVIVQPKKQATKNSRQRPKSLVVKSRTRSDKPPHESGSSSQEDLVQTASRSIPNIMSKNMSPLHASRLPQPSHIRKAVSCNILQGSSNGTRVASTSQRPLSPDLYRLRQRQRGSSQDSGSETGSGSNPGSDYAGPKLFVKPASRSNRHIIVNAISHCCLAGSVNVELKNKVLEEMSKCEASHFLILFRDAGCQYKSLYLFDPDTEEAVKVYGVGPKYLKNEMCEKFYKYNSGSKSFSEITSTKHLSVSVDAVALHNSVWKSPKISGKT